MKDQMTPPEEATDQHPMKSPRKKKSSPSSKPSTGSVWFIESRKFEKDSGAELLKGYPEGLTFQINGTKGTWKP